jgi:hypothetical protein
LQLTATAPAAVHPDMTTLPLVTPAVFKLLVSGPEMSVAQFGAIWTPLGPVMAVAALKS